MRSTHWATVANQNLPLRLGGEDIKLSVVSDIPPKSKFQAAATMHARETFDGDNEMQELQSFQTLVHGSFNADVLSVPSIVIRPSIFCALCFWAVEVQCI